MLCCLSYEHSFYNEQIRRIPQEGTKVSHENDTWTVTEANMITGQVKISNGDGRLINLAADRFERIDNRWRTK